MLLVKKDLGGVILRGLVFVEESQRLDLFYTAYAFAELLSAHGSARQGFFLVV